MKKQNIEEIKSKNGESFKRYQVYRAKLKKIKQQENYFLTVDKKEFENFLSNKTSFIKKALEEIIIEDIKGTAIDDLIKDSWNDKIEITTILFKNVDSLRGVTLHENTSMLPKIPLHANTTAYEIKIVIPRMSIRYGDGDITWIREENGVDKTFGVDLKDIELKYSLKNPSSVSIKTIYDEWTINILKIEKAS